MQLSAHAKKDSLVFSNMEMAYSTPKALNNVPAQFSAQDEIFKTISVRQSNMALFVKGFCAVVNTEIRKSFDCIMLIEQNINIEIYH